MYITYENVACLPHLVKVRVEYGEEDNKNKKGYNSTVREPGSGL
jgi:hypothetical protein